MKEYVAGFLDADGSVTLHSKTSKHSWQRAPQVDFYNADFDLLMSIQKKYGGKIKTQTFENKNWNTSYNLVLQSNSALDLLVDVLPYMRHKKKKRRAELIVKHYKHCTPRNGKYTPELIKKKEWLNNEVMSIQMRGAGAY